MGYFVKMGKEQNRDVELMAAAIKQARGFWSLKMILGLCPDADPKEVIDGLTNRGCFFIAGLGFVGGRMDPQNFCLLREASTRNAKSGIIDDSVLEKVPKGDGHKSGWKRVKSKNGNGSGGDF